MKKNYWAARFELMWFYLLLTLLFAAVSGHANLSGAGKPNQSYVKKCMTTRLRQVAPVQNLNIKALLIKPEAYRQVEYKVVAGDALNKIAARFKVNMQSIVAVNAIKNPNKIYIGQVLKIRVTTVVLSGRSLAIVKKPIETTHFNYPTKGFISSQFGMRYGRMHQGVDIAAPQDTPIEAYESGTVTYAGWSSGYGLLVVVRHTNGCVTRYGHCHIINVKLGEEVSKGQCIAKVGATGRATGSHLHFELNVNGKNVNPLNYLN